MKNIETEAEEFMIHLEQLGYVKVIRCKDCKHWDGKYHYCEKIDDSRDWDANDYCSVAERKEEIE